MSLRTQKIFKNRSSKSLQVFVIYYTRSLENSFQKTIHATFEGYACTMCLHNHFVWKCLKWRYYETNHVLHLMSLPTCSECCVNASVGVKCFGLITISHAKNILCHIWSSSHGNSLHHSTYFILNNMQRDHDLTLWLHQTKLFYGVRSGSHITMTCHVSGSALYPHCLRPPLSRSHSFGRQMPCSKQFLVPREVDSMVFYFREPYGDLIVGMTLATSHTLRDKCLLQGFCLLQILLYTQDLAFLEDVDYTLKVSWPTSCLPLLARGIYTMSFAVLSLSSLHP